MKTLVIGTLAGLLFWGALVGVLVWAERDPGPETVTVPTSAILEP